MDELQRLSHWLLPHPADVDANGEALERFVSTVLVDAGLWQGRPSDGVRDYRLVEDGPRRARLCGELWTIDQTRHVFWIDLIATEEPDTVEWTLFYELQAAPRRAHEAVHLLDSPDEDAWSARVSGRGTFARQDVQRM